MPSSRRPRLASGVFDQHAFGFFPLRHGGRSRSPRRNRSIPRNSHEHDPETPRTVRRGNPSLLCVSRRGGRRGPPCAQAAASIPKTAPLWPWCARAARAQGLPALPSSGRDARRSPGRLRRRCLARLAGGDRDALSQCLATAGDRGAGRWPDGAGSGTESRDGTSGTGQRTPTLRDRHRGHAKASPLLLYRLAEPVLAEA